MLVNESNCLDVFLEDAATVHESVYDIGYESLTARSSVDCECLVIHDFLLSGTALIRHCFVFSGFVDMHTVTTMVPSYFGTI